MVQKVFSAIASYGVAVGQWVEAHPVFATVVFWPLVTAILTAILKPRTPEQYAALAARNPSWFFARWAALLQLIGATGLDAPKAIRVLRKFWGGTFEPLPPPSGPSKLPFVVLFLGAGALGLGASSCTPQATALFREMLADKIRCGIAHQDLPNDMIIKRCALDPEDIPKVIEAVGESRKAGAAHAALAAARAAHDAHEEACASPR